jgi:hypothetical protein
MAENLRPAKPLWRRFLGPVIVTAVVLLGLMLLGPDSGGTIFRYKLF